MPLRAGSAPEPITVALPRVTVGTTEWLLANQTPSPRIRHRFGVSAGLTESGRSPSTMKTIVSGFPAARAGPAARPAANSAATPAARNLRITQPLSSQP